MTTEYYVSSELKNLVATAIGKSKSVTLIQLAGDPDVQDVLRKNIKKFPADLAKKINIILADPVENLNNGKVCFDALLYVTGIKDKTVDTVAATYSASNFENQKLKLDGFLPSASEAGSFTKNLYQSLGSAAINNPQNALETLTDKNKLAASASGPSANFLKGALGRIPGFDANNIPGGTLNSAISDAIKGDFAGAGESLLTGGLATVTSSLLKWGLNQLGKLIGIPIGPRDNPYKDKDYAWAVNTPPSAPTYDSKIKHNIGYGLSTRVLLGGIEFQLPPSTTSVLPIHGGVQGQTAPGAEAGIKFEHFQNYASLMIPGSAPVYQSLGIQGMVIEFVGAFIGYDKKRLLNNTVNDEFNTKDQLNKIATWPDPPYNDAEHPGEARGSWEFSRDFLNQVKDGVPMQFTIVNSIAGLPTEIKYKVIVLNFTRWYRDKGRTYYRFKCFAVGGLENGGNETYNIPRKATGIKRNKAAAHRNSGGKSRNSNSGGSAKSTEVKSSDAKTKAVADNPTNILTYKRWVAQIGPIVSDLRAANYTGDNHTNDRIVVLKHARNFISLANKAYAKITDKAVVEKERQLLKSYIELIGKYSAD